MKCRTLLPFLACCLSVTGLHAQEDCANLSIVSVEFDPFDSMGVDVHVVNNGNIGWSYPGLFLFDTNGDTLASDPGSFFAIGYDQVFHLNITPGAVLPPTPFYASLQLYTDFVDSLRCTFYTDALLCPPCAEVYPYIIDMQTAPGGYGLGWTVTDDDGTVVNTGSVQVPSGAHNAMDTTCLAAGHYSISFFNPWLNGDSIQFGIQGPGWTTGGCGFQPLMNATCSFTVLPRCADQGNGISTIEAPAIAARWENGAISIASTMTSGAVVDLMDTAGRIMMQRTLPIGTSTAHLPWSEPGVWLVMLRSTDGRRSAARVVVP